MQPSYTIQKIQKEISRYTKQPVYAVFFKSSDGGSYKSWLDPKNGNFKRWEALLKVGNTLSNIKVKTGRLIDADSFPLLVQVEPDPLAEPEVEAPQTATMFDIEPEKDLTTRKFYEL